MIRQPLLSVFMMTLLFLSLFSPSAQTAFVIHDSGNYNNDTGNPNCIPQADANRYTRDFGINADTYHCERMTGDRCSGEEVWQLMWSVSYLEKMRDGIANPNSWVRNLYNWTKRRTISYCDAGSGSRYAGFNAYNQVLNNAENPQVILTNRFFNIRNPLRRMFILAHEARHSDGEEFLHVVCEDGPMEGLHSCDQEFRNSGGGAYSVMVNLAAWVVYNGRYRHFAPAAKEWARDFGNATLDERFITQPDYRINYDPED